MSVRDYITRSPRLQPSKEASPSRRDATNLANEIARLSEHIASENRPHISSRFIDTEHGTSDPIELLQDQINGVVHWLGRPYKGWQLAGQKGPGTVFECTDEEIATNNIDTSVYLPLRCTQTVTVRLVVW